jgi:hypothetical protein
MEAAVAAAAVAAAAVAAAAVAARGDAAHNCRGDRAGRASGGAYRLQGTRGITAAVCEHTASRWGGGGTTGARLPG